jgi:hypothetical protein
MRRIQLACGVCHRGNSPASRARKVGSAAHAILPAPHAIRALVTCVRCTWVHVPRALCRGQARKAPAAHFGLQRREFGAPPPENTVTRASGVAGGPTRPISSRAGQPACGHAACGVRNDIRVREGQAGRRRSLRAAGTRIIRGVCSLQMAPHVGICETARPATKRLYSRRKYMRRIGPVCGACGLPAH